MHRTRPALFLKESPLILVLAQVRFSPIAKIGDFVPDVQERVRRNGFPRFQEGLEQEIRLGPPDGVLVRHHPRWEFQDAKRRTGLILSANTLILQTNAYTTFDAFSEQLAMAVEALGEIAEPALVERLGLRYVDLIRPEPGEDWKDYVQAGLHGLEPENIGMRRSIRRSEAVGDTDHGRLVVRFARNLDTECLPPDLRPSSLDYSHVGPMDVTTTLDLDHACEDPFDFRGATILERFWGLHDGLDLAFRNATTEHALKAWKVQHA